MFRVKVVSSLPAEDVMVFTPSTFFIVVHTNYGIDLEVQITPVMQLYIKACDYNKGTLRGSVLFINYLCSNG